MTETTDTPQAAGCGCPDFVRASSAPSRRGVLAGAAALVPLLTGRLATSPGATIVPIVCGGNIDVERLKGMI